MKYVKRYAIHLLQSRDSGVHSPNGLGGVAFFKEEHHAVTYWKGSAFPEIPFAVIPCYVPEDIAEKQTVEIW